MKKMFVILSLIAFAMPSYASTMCVANDMVAVVLDPSIDGTNYTYDAANMLWTTNFDYGNVSGDALCSTTSGSYATVGTPNESGGGQYCWCRAQHPVASLWVFNADRGSSGNCARDCASDCAYYGRINAAFRAGLFGSVAPLGKGQLC